MKDRGVEERRQRSRPSPGSCAPLSPEYQWMWGLLAARSAPSGEAVRSTRTSERAAHLQRWYSERAAGSALLLPRCRNVGAELGGGLLTAGERPDSLHSTHAGTPLNINAVYCNFLEEITEVGWGVVPEGRPIERVNSTRRKDVIFSYNFA